MPFISNTVLESKPLTNSVPLNMAIGAAVAAAPNVGFGSMLQGMDALGAAGNTGIAAFLNIFVAQPIKNISWFNQNKWLAPLMFVAAFAVAYFIVFNQEVSKAFIEAGTSTLTAIAQYKGDKAAGTNILKPAER